MLTRQQKLEFPHNVVGYIKHWSQRPTVLLLSGSLLILVFILTLAGGLFFWTYQLIPVFANNNSSNQSELSVARAIMQNMKRMVGNQQAWSESIQEEYGKLSANQQTKTQIANYSHSENFVGSNYSINQESTNQISIK